MRLINQSFFFLIFISFSAALCFCQKIPRAEPLSVSKDLSVPIFNFYLLFLYKNNLFKTLQAKNDFIYLNTIDGYFYAIDKLDGNIKWLLKEQAVLNFPKNYEK